MPEKQIKRKKAKALPEKTSPLSFILSTLLSFAIFYSYIDVYYDKALQLHLFIACAVVGAILCLVFFLKDKAWGLIPLSALVIVLMPLMFKEDFRFACQDLIQGFIKAYNSYMYVPIDLSFVQNYRANGFVCIFLMIQFWVLLWNTCWKWPLISVLPGLGLLAMGVVTNEYPDFIGTTLMLAAYFGLLSLKNTKSLSSALSLVAVTAAAALVINFTLLPLYNRFTNKYSRPLITYQTRIIEDVKGGNADKLMSDFLTAKGDEVVLNDDEINHLGKTMLTVTSEMPVMETLYLRGYSAADYTGISWVANNENEFRYYCDDHNLKQKDVYEYNVTGTLSTIFTIKHVGDESDYIYSPYNSRLTEGAEIVSDNYLVKIDSDVNEYKFSVFWPLPKPSIMEKYSDWAYEKYLDLGALENSEVLQKITSGYRGDSPADAVLYTKEILSRYSYTKTPPALPKDKDYVEYFLTESKTGYCQHFASAGVMILRQLGVPARYVTGYAVPADNFVKTTKGYYYSVPDYLSHAWVEVYTEESGWQVFDFTPASALARPGVDGVGGTGTGDGDEPALPGANTPEEPYNYFNYAPDEEFIFPEKEQVILPTLDFGDFIPTIIIAVVLIIVTIVVWYKVSERFEAYRVARFDFSTGRRRHLAISRNFRSLEFCVPARATDDDYSYMDYALSKFLDEDEIKLYKAVIQENFYGNDFSFDEKEVIDLMKKLRNKLIYSLKPVKQFIFLYILCY